MLILLIFKEVGVEGALYEGPGEQRKHLGEKGVEIKKKRTERGSKIVTREKAGVKTAQVASAPTKRLKSSST